MSKATLSVKGTEIKEVKDAEFDSRYGGCKCQLCGKRYKVDWMIPDEIWLKISPKKSLGGLLCGSCIAELIEEFDEFGMFECVTDSFSFQTLDG
jgi:hypothetical protein